MITLLFGASVPAFAGMRGRMLHLINNVRHANGEHPLKMNNLVSHDARHHSRAMADRGYLFHTRNVPGLLAGRPWSAWGENIAEAKTVTSTFRAWMASPEHRVNILDPRFRMIAIGIAPKAGWLWSTTDFWG